MSEIEDCETCEYETESSQEHCGCCCPQSRGESNWKEAGWIKNQELSRLKSDRSAFAAETQKYRDEWLGQQKRIGELEAEVAGKDAELSRLRNIVETLNCRIAPDEGEIYFRGKLLKDWVVELDKLRKERDTAEKSMNRWASKYIANNKELKKEKEKKQ